MASHPSPPLVWVTQGRTQHPAYLLEDKQIPQGEALIRWQSNGKSETVSLHDIARNLLPRRRNRPDAYGTPGKEEVAKRESPSQRTGSEKVSAQQTSDSRDTKRRKSATNAAQKVTPHQDTLRHSRIPLHVDSSYLSSSDTSDNDEDEDDDDDDYSVDTQEDMLLVDLVPDKNETRSAKKSKTSIVNVTTGSEVIVLDRVQAQADSEDISHSKIVAPSEKEAEDEVIIMESFQVNIKTHTQTSPKAIKGSIGEHKKLEADDSILEDVVPLIKEISATQGNSNPVIGLERPCLETPGRYPKTTQCDRSKHDHVIHDAQQIMEPPTIIETSVSDAICSELDHASCADKAPLRASILFPESESKPERPAAPTNDTTSSDTSNDVKPSYTFKSSAYVQNLAEICDTIMNDRRWRVENGNPLFGWENGDDLSVVARLSQLYQKPPPVELQPCPCPLCKGGAKPALPVTNEQEGQVEIEDGDDEDSRALNLYCRLYYRKGPWFRIDDIYTKYYAPKRRYLANASESQEKEASSASQGKGDNRCTVIDETMFQEAIMKMNEMLADVNSLCNQGFLRTFGDEEECGKISGSVTPEGGGVLLNADERRSVLQKLGGSKKPNGRRESGRGKQSTSPRENDIWKQMCQQQSIAAGMMLTKGKNNSRHLLPVRQHVNREILAKLATAVVMSASCAEYVPAGVMRAKLLEVKQSMSVITNQRSTQAMHFSKFDTSFRLREAPLLTLRRCCRLYLCATSGPGNMRGDGTNGWKSLRDCLKGNVSLPMTRLVPQPGDNTWNSTVYPGLASRFGLCHFGFTDAYTELRVTKGTQNDDAGMEQVFPDIASFRLWELTVEIRANIDYVVELNEMILYDERKKARVAAEDEEALPCKQEAKSFLLDVDEQGEEVSRLHVDFLELLDKSTRRIVVSQFCSCLEATNEKDELIGQELVIRQIEDSIAGVFIARKAPDSDSERGDVAFRTDCEKIIVVVALIATKLLHFGYQNMAGTEKVKKVHRCWLRHLWWEGVLAYVLWDCIPILEKRGMYRLASRALEVLVFGTFQPDTWKQAAAVHGWGASILETPVGDIMISRRARGKAIERLMIDYIHMLRKELKDRESEEMETRIEKPKKKKANVGATTAATTVNVLCYKILAAASKTGFISFAAIRAIARRTKKPLHQLLEPGGCREAVELGLRLSDEPLDDTIQSKGYADWTPKTDEAVAMSLNGVENGVGSRCSYVGFEDSKGAARATSLNVEELAMEYYATGRLPIADDRLGGGAWVGWHDEGGRLRTLFRILCAHPVLGMDGGCGSNPESKSCEHSTVHLAKYQGAPFDLHVGSWSHVTNNASTAQSVSGFYNRRKARIDQFLAKLENASHQDLATYVYDAVDARSKAKARGPNTILASDIQQVRSLSMLAAGFGGKHLSAAFRCFFFDYRHYSGGLPDLLLVRAVYSDSANGTKDFVDIGEWVGEGFSPEAQAEREAASRSNFLIDKDDEFLGCSKVGDSGASRSNNRWTRQPRQREPPKPLPKLPEKLTLSHNKRPIEVQCMFVEVKSQNDRLDGRQEDWLNVLDRVGNARVCKFVSNKKSKKKEP